jgi:hypothetical protein
VRPIYPQLAYVEYTTVGQPFRAAAVRTAEAMRHHDKLYQHKRALV